MAFSGIADEEIQAVSGILSHTGGQVSGSATAKPDDDTHATSRPPEISAAAPPARRQPGAPPYADPQTPEQLSVPCRAVHVGDELSVGELTIRAVGGRHAVIHPEIPVIDNISYLVGDGEHPARFMHPGDALFVPDEPVDVLATPAAAPWMGISEAGAYLRGVAPSRAVPIPQAVVAPEARGIYYGRLSEMTTADFQVLPEE